jgi:hypothetical protein
VKWFTFFVRHRNIFSLKLIETCDRGLLQIGQSGFILFDLLRIQQLKYETAPLKEFDWALKKLLKSFSKLKDS